MLPRTLISWSDSESAILCRGKTELRSGSHGWCILIANGPAADSVRPQGV